MRPVMCAGPAARPNRHAEDRELCAQVMRLIIAESRAEARWARVRRMVQGLGVVALVVVGVIAVMSW